MIETVLALLLIVDHEIKEHRIQDSLSTCLKMKREASRNMNMDNKVYMCGEVEAELETNIDGSKTIKKIVKSK